MAPDSVLAAAQYLWQVHYIKLTLQSRLRAQCDFWGALIAAALQSVRAFRVSGGDIFYLWYTLSGHGEPPGVVVCGSFIIPRVRHRLFFIVLVHLTIIQLY